MEFENTIIGLIQDDNYEQAAEVYEKRKNNQSLSIAGTLQLAWAYHCIDNYEAALGLLENIPFESYKTIALKYEGVILELKQRYLLEKQIDISLKKIDFLLKSDQLSDVHINALKDLKAIVNCHVNDRSIRELEQQALEFQKLCKDQIQTPQNNTLNWQGFSVYLIPKGWFQQWKNYVRLNQRALDRSCPGVISQFQILDHKYYHLNDPLPQKYFTNQLLFDTQNLIAFPRRCWQFLVNRYGGFPIERYNILNISNTIQTQIELLPIYVIIKGQTNNNMFVQISRISFWKDLEDKLIRILGKGRIFKMVGEKMFQIQPMKLLQNDDISDIKVMFEKKSQFESKPEPLKISNKCCANCGKTQKLKLCQDCKSVRYCNMQCMKIDHRKHEGKCKLAAKKSLQLQSFSLKFNLNNQQAIKRKAGVVGLRNLGNTCYINSSLQCLSNTKDFTMFFMSSDFVKQLNLTNILGSGGQIAIYYAKLIRELWTTDDSSISSWQLKKQICKKFTQFAGYSQHDSLEFLGALLDVLHEDTNQVKIKPITSQKQTERSDKQASDESYDNYQKRNKSFISDRLTSQYKTLMVCPKCSRKLTSFQQFTILPLPIPQSFEVQINFVRAKHINQKINLILFPSDTIRDVAETISKAYIIRSQNLKFFRFEDDYSIKYEYKFTDNIDMLLKIGREQLNACYQVQNFESQENNVYKIKFYEDNSRDKISYPRFVMLEEEDNQTIIRTIKQSLQIYTQITIKQSLFKWKLKGKSIQVYLTKNIFRRQSNYCSIQQLEVHKETQSHSLKQCYDLFSKEQVLDEQNTWYCKNCKDHVRATRKMQLYKTNKILIISFKRYSKGKKIKTLIEYNLSIDISQMGAHSTGLYQLYGVVNHYGSLMNGHYTAYCKNFINNKWYQFNDSKVTSIKQEAVINSNAYILFYQKKQ